MESLGGNELFLDRFVAQHIAFFYYWIVVVLYMVSPATAYDLNKHVEQHAFNTYDEFLTTHAEELKLLPAPQVAVDYYQEGGTQPCFILHTFLRVVDTYIHTLHT